MKSLAWCTILLLCTFAVRGEDLGVKGQTYKLDLDAREQLKSVVSAKEKSGELNKFWNQYRDRTIELAKHPPALGLPTDFSSRRVTRPATFVFQGAIRDAAGRVVVQRGTRVNPLEFSPLSGWLVFIDGRDRAQVESAVRLGKSTPVKIVLVGGSAFDLRVKYQDHPWYAGTRGVPFYFDQRRMIINSLSKLYDLNINSVPAVLRQKGTSLEVEFGEIR